MNLFCTDLNLTPPALYYFIRQVRFFSCRDISERRRRRLGIGINRRLRELGLLCSNSNQPQRGQQFDPAQTHLRNVSFSFVQAVSIFSIPFPNIFHFLIHLTLI